MRGLKLKAQVSETWSRTVASFTDAWIETVSMIARTAKALVASFTDAWIETEHTHTKDVDSRRIFYRCVD